MICRPRIASLRLPESQARRESHRPARVRRWLAAAALLIAGPGALLAQSIALNTATRTLDPAGGRATFTADLNYSGNYGFELAVMIPRGWEYVSGTGEPAAHPFGGAQVKLEWSDHTEARPPGRISFTVQYPAGVISASVVPTLTLTQDLGYPTHVGFPSWKIVSQTEGTPLNFGPLVPPTILYQPVNRVQGVDGSLGLTVSAEGTAPLRYQWRKNGVPLAGATNRYYSPNSGSAQLSDNGSYDVVVSNSVGSVTSRAATLTVKAVNPGQQPPIIEAHPADTRVTTGGLAVFSVVVLSNYLPSFQWTHNGVPIPDGTNQALVLPNVHSADAGAYGVTVRHPYAASVSRTATLFVDPPPPVGEPPRIVTPPADVATVVSEAGQLRVAAEGTPPLAYQWFLNGTPIPAATADTLDLATVMGSPNSGNYSVVVSNAMGAVRSRPAVVRLDSVDLAGTTSLGSLTTVKTTVNGSATFTASTIGTPPFSFQWFKGDTAIPGATNATLTIAPALPSDAGRYRVVVGNVYASAQSSHELVIEAAPIAPTFSSFSPNRAVAFENALTLSGGVESTRPLQFQWLKNDVEIAGATQSELTIPAAQFADAGAYRLRVTNTAGSVTSPIATLTVTPPEGAYAFIGPSGVPAIETQPVASTVREGMAATLQASAQSKEPLRFQWRRNGVAIAGATGTTYSLLRATVADAGIYSVVAWNARGAAISEGVRLAVGGLNPRGTYVGTFSDGGSLVLQVREDNTAALLGFLAGTKTGLVARTVTIGNDNRFRAPIAGTPRLTLDGAIGPNGSVSGTVAGTNVTFTAAPVADAGSTQALRGFFEASSSVADASTPFIVSATGTIYLLTEKSGVADWATGTVDASGGFNATTRTGVTATGEIDPQSGTVNVSLRNPDASVVTLAGGREARGGRERLRNVSTRAATATGAGTMTAGFVISGTTPLPVLIRAVGPTLSEFGVGGLLTDAQLELFRGPATVTTNRNWSAAAGASGVADAAQRVGAFALPAGSKDAAILATLEPGAYTAQVTGGTGVALVEVYDATTAATGASRLINLATRAQAGSGNNALAAGFVVLGPNPQRVLIRGIGPGLAPFGVTGALADPVVRLFSGADERAKNENWSDSPNASDIAIIGGHVGAFALDPGSKDAALLVELQPGAYTVHVTGAGDTTGVALIEIYEVP